MSFELYQNDSWLWININNILKIRHQPRQLKFPREMKNSSRKVSEFELTQIPVNSNSLTLLELVKVTS